MPRKPDAEEALQILVNDEVISAGRMREILAMTPEDQRAHWRLTQDMAVCPPIHAEIRRAREGLSELLVSIHVEGQWYTVIREKHVDGGHLSHIIEPLGIMLAIERAKEAQPEPEEPQADADATR